MLGGLGGWLAGVRALAIPVLGPYIAAGATALGAGVGTILGGIAGPGLARPRGDRDVEQRGGDTLVLVHAGNSSGPGRARTAREPGTAGGACAAECDGLIDLWYKNAIIYAIEVRPFADGNDDGVGDFRGLAAADEDARPVRKAWCDLPPLPPTSQWAEFLRVHDELDLGCLTPAERERCYAAFAPDPNMRLYDRGIRRRLASMFGGDRRRIELLNSLLFPLQGTPVIRYGEEIGMGEDLRLPERYAIRTPMQWSSEPNAGFSTAPPDKLIRPVISEGPFSYQRVNVAAQRLYNSSLLNWVARAIRTRKECPEFGWGCMDFLDTNHHAVLAHTCTWRGTTVAAIHNFSGSPCSVKITWPYDTTGVEPVFGPNIEAPLTAPPTVIDLDSYEYRWLRLRRRCSGASTTEQA